MKFVDVRKTANERFKGSTRGTKREDIREQLDASDLYERALACMKTLRSLSREEIRGIVEKGIGSENLSKLLAMASFLETECGEDVSGDFTMNIVVLTLLQALGFLKGKLEFTDLVFQALHAALSKRLKKRLGAFAPGLPYVLDVYCIRFKGVDCLALLLSNPQALRDMLIATYGSHQVAEIIAREYLSTLLENVDQQHIGELVETLFHEPSKLRTRIQELLERSRRSRETPR